MTHLQEELKYLRENLVEMARLVNKQLKKSVDALLNGDNDLANEVLFNEKRVNATELKIDKDCEHIFALLSPVAQDMRFAFATLKINADLERIGDYAEGIAKLTLLGKNAFDKDLMKELELKKMHTFCCEMMNDITEAYFNDDSKLASSIFTRDHQLNDINHNATDIIVNYCRKNPDNIHQALYLLSVVRKLERAGDHMTNIAEEVIFHKEARVLKHNKKSDDDNDDMKIIM